MRLSYLSIPFPRQSLKSQNGNPFFKFHFMIEPFLSKTYYLCFISTLTNYLSFWICGLPKFYSQEHTFSSVENYQNPAIWHIMTYGVVISVMSVMSHVHQLVPPNTILTHCDGSQSDLTANVWFQLSIFDWTPCTNLLPGHSTD